MLPFFSLPTASSPPDRHVQPAPGCRCSRDPHARRRQGRCGRPWHQWRRQLRPARMTRTEEPGHGGLCASAHHRRGAEPQQESGMGERGLHGSSVLRGHSVQIGNERRRVSGGDGEKSHRRSSRIAGCTA